MHKVFLFGFYRDAGFLPAEGGSEPDLLDCGYNLQCICQKIASSACDGQDLTQLAHWLARGLNKPI